MPNERDNTPAPDISVAPVDLPPFDFQLRGPVYNPLNWYWASDDGRVYSSRRDVIVGNDDEEYKAWKGDHERAPTFWPRDADGKETVEALRDVMAAYGRKVPE
jgi:hypothetical protein